MRVLAYRNFLEALTGAMIRLLRRRGIRVQQDAVDEAQAPEGTQISRCDACGAFRLG